MNQKTIFITSFFGLIARNILATNFLSILRQQNLKIVIFVPESKKNKYEKEFGNDNIIFEGIKQLQPSFFDSIFTVVFHNLSDTQAWKIHRLINIKKNKKYLSAPFYWILSKLGYLKFVRFFARRFDYLLSQKERFTEYFKKYNPDLVFATDIFESEDIDLIREAKHRNIKTVGMIRSWDNITTKGLNRIITDRLVVNSPKIKEEAIKYCDFKSENIFIVGIPHYDAYITEPRISKQKLFDELKLDPNKKTIFFAAPSDIYTQGDPITKKVVDFLMQMDVQIILRLYIVGKVNIGDIKSISGKLAIDDPGSGSDFSQTDLTGKDFHLADLLYHSDVVLVFASTLAIDAIVFNKPVVFIGFDGEENRPYWKSLRRFYDYDHQRSIIETGGIRLAKTPQEMLLYLEKYLKNPDMNSDGRKRIIDERCWKLDGKSGERLSSIILKQL